MDLAPTQEGFDKTTLNNIKATAKAVAVEYVIKPPHTGEFVQVGWRNRLRVLISRGTKPAAVRNRTLSDQ